MYLTKIQKVRLDMTLSVDSGTIVTLHFALVLEDGHVIDSNLSLIHI